MRKLFSALGWLTFIALSAPEAGAQSLSIDMQRYKPGPNATDLLGVHGARVGRGWHLGASFSYAHEPLGLHDQRQDKFIAPVILMQRTLNLMGSFSCGRFELGLALPFTSQTSGLGTPAPPVFPWKIAGNGPGDVRLVSKVAFFSSSQWHLGAVLPVVFPTAGGKAFRGGAGLAVQPQLIGEWEHEGGTRLLANLGVHLRKQERLNNLLTGGELLYALGTEVPLGRRFALQAQLAGAMGLIERDAEERPLELLASVQYRVPGWLRVHLGGGPGLSHGYGTPSFRFVAGVDWLYATNGR